MISNAARMLALPLFVSGLAVSANAASITVDGNLSDLLDASLTNPLAPFNWAAGTDSSSDGDGPGFNITNTYAYYDRGLDTFYIGMSFAGDVGTSGGTEGDPLAFGPVCSATDFNNVGSAGVFDGYGCEKYGFNLSIDGVATNAVNLRIEGDGVAGSGAGTEAVTVFDNAYGATVNWAVGDGVGGDGVEFSVTGLLALLEPMSISSPRDVTINFFAGSILNAAGEDQATLNMQVVPVPAAFWLLGSGFVGLVGTAWRRRSSRI